MYWKTTGRNAPAGRATLGTETAWYKLPIWHCAVTLQSAVFDMLSCLAGVAIESQPGIDSDIPLPESAIVSCMGHCPAVPLAASPVRGSTAQSNTTKNVRRNFMGRIIAQRFVL
jgi:hypothetical protein